MWNGAVLSIHIAPAMGEPMEQRQEVRTVAGAGIEGDRYIQTGDLPDRKLGKERQITLVEQEAIDAVARDYDTELGSGDTRRNLITRGVPLNHLVGRQFRVGEALLRGVKLAEPCGYLAKKIGKKAVAGLIHRGGLRAEVMEGGRIQVGDKIEPVDSLGDPDSAGQKGAST